MLCAFWFTVGSTFVLSSGQEVSATELFHLDGTPSRHFEPWRDDLCQVGESTQIRLETTATKDGKDAGVVTYEVSADGKTLTSRCSTSPDQVRVFNRHRG
jgi:hypothetical protein